MTGEQLWLETILNEIPAGIVVVDLDGRIALVNRSGLAALGLDENGTIGKPAGEVLACPELVEFFRGGLQEVPYRSEVRLENGRVFNLQIAPVEPIGLALTLQDITQLKKLDQVKGEFVDAISHDLRSPLTAILGYADLIGRVGPVNPQQSEFIQRIRVNVQNIAMLISDLLELGRIEAGLDLRKEETSIPAVVGSAVDELREQVVEKGQVLKVNLPEDLPVLLGNPTHLRRMAKILIANAIKFSSRGGEIEVSSHSEGDQVILEFKDHGIGIPQNEQAHIFERYFRASNVPANLPGSGLGLAIVKSIVEDHQGRIWVESSPGEGCVVTVVLPAVKSLPPGR